MSVFNWACVIFLAGAGLIAWAIDHKPPTYRTPDQVEADVAAHRAQRRMQEAIDSLRTCREIYDLPTIPSQRKETGQ
ncbi:hypothetical protein [Streptomyces showdoensis]|uniref:Uncharacterized protein n=1 Tax=Streptomyces showdoensis TaxID=68268 RepID=A0A2P2GVG7_STREW|nr:hypothetical protein [Streptomyces showdoensis]KKZ74879.1 hypothetical protein VO63_05375 [Streptomyces showdoensis]